jgi:hypothetical protein
VKPDAAHDVDRWRKDAESDGGVSAEMRRICDKVDGLSGNRDLAYFARLVEDNPADAAMMSMLLLVALGQCMKPHGDAVMAAVTEAETTILARYDAKPKVER